jgi:2'-hydroxyisoflavone reductase
MARGGKVIAPNIPNQPVQLIDVRDLSEWCIRLLEGGVTGTFNATGPQTPYTLKHVLELCKAGTEAEIVWVDPAKLTELGAEPWSDFPFVLEFSGDRYGIMHINVDRAIAAGLTYRPLPETIKDTVAWALSRSTEEPLKAGMSLQRHSAMLDAVA